MPANMVPELGQRAVAVGKTCSGKTTTVTTLLAQVAGVYPLLIIDSKGDQKFLGLPFARPIYLPSKLTYSGTEIYRPDGILNTAPYLDALLNKAYESQVSMYVYVDELYQVASRFKPGIGLGNLLMRGRHRIDRHGRVVRVSLIMSTQRPSIVPLHALTESEHYYIHKLTNPDDIKRMADYTHPLVKREPVAGHDFWYYNHVMPEPIKVRLHLGKGDRVGTSAR